MYKRTLENGITIASTRPEHALQLEQLQEIVFPTLAPEERFQAAHYLKHIELFPEGQFVALDGESVVGMTSSIRLHFDFDHINHTFADLIQGGWLTSHQPDGAWLYGADIGTHPQHRRKGIGRALYAARQHTVRELGLKGQVTVGMMNGYSSVQDQMTVEEYYQKLFNGECTDPTISAQQRIGFELRALVPNYVKDPTCGNAGILIVLDAAKQVG
ncbi:MAG: GNAT family N-acetyltransferase [bacterium]|nr:GNAT family N-acetyltransferase [bacterium]